MSENNGNGNGRILSLGDARKPKAKGSDLLTRDQCAVMIAEECTKVHEYYLTQIPPFVARMIQDALLSFGLIKMDPAVEAGLVQAAINEATPLAADAIPASGDTAVPGSIAAAEGPSGLLPPSAANVPTDSEGPEAA